MSTYTSRKKAALRSGLSYSKLLSTSALTAASLMALSPAALANNWTDHVATGGGSIDVNVDGGNSTTNITQNGQIVKVQGDGDIDAGWTVNVAQPSSSAKYILFDIENDPTFIRGKLNANGEIYIFDADGTIFTANSEVNVGAIIASTGTISDANLFAGKMVIEDIGTDGEILIESGASITVSEAGLAAFVAPTVSNSGVINAKLGKVVFAAGEEVTLDLYGDGLVEITVDGELEDALLENTATGQINAEGGTVQMTAKAAKGAVDNIINVEGLVTVASAEVQGGKIVLSGGSKGNVNVGGTLDASGTDGGSIDVAGENVTIAETAELYADGGRGANQNGDGGRVDLIANNLIDFRGQVFARGGAFGGNGGFTEVSGENFIYDGLVDLTAEYGDIGTLLLDPAFIIIHSGLLNLPNPFGDPVTEQNILASWKLANALATASVELEADNFIDVGLRDSYGGPIADALTDLGVNLGLLGDGDINLSEWNVFGFTGPTAGSLTLNAAEVNFNTDLIMGAGNVGVDAATVNLDSKIYASDGTTLLGDSRLIGSEQLTTINVNSDSASINQGIGFADSSQRETVNVAAGLYEESVALNKSVDLLGANAGVAGTDARGAESIIDPSSPGVLITADGAVLDGFEVVGGTPGVHVNNADNVTVKNNHIHSQTDTNTTVSDAVQVNNSQGVTIERNLIENTNDEGIYANGNVDGLQILNNTIQHIGMTNGTQSFAIELNNTSGSINIEENFIDDVNGTGAYGGTAIMAFNGSPDLTIFNNHITNHDGYAVYENIAGIINASGNYWGTTSEHAINNSMFGDVDFSTYLTLGTDTDLGAAGFQGDFSDLFVTSLGAQTQTGGRINEAIGLLENGSLTGGDRIIHVMAGVYDESVNVNKSVNLRGWQADFAPDARNGAGEAVVTGGSPGFTVNASDVTINGFTIDGPDLDYGVYINDQRNTTISNNIIRNTDTAGIGGVVDHDNTPGTLIITNNKIDDSNEADGINLSGDSAGENGNGYLVGVNIQITDNEIGTDGPGDGNGADNGVGGQGIVLSGLGDIGGDIADGGTNVSAVVNIDGNEIHADGNAIRFNGVQGAGADVDITDNIIDSDESDGISFGGSTSVSGGAHVDINGNTITADYDGVYVDGDITGASTHFWVGGNNITAGDDGVDLDHIGNAAQVNIGGVIAHDGASATGYNQGNAISADGNGVEIDAGADAIVFIRGNRIGAGADGVNIRDEDSGHTTGVDGGTVQITNNDIGSEGGDTIGDDGIDFDDSITGGSTVLISGNNIGRSGAYVGDDGIDIDSITGGSTVTIENNPNIYASDNGIEVSGAINGGADVNITGNNHGIHAGDHGMYFGGNISGNATLDIHDNIIQANLNRDAVGSGIFFDGTVTNADINIGNGTGANKNSGGSNVISVRGNNGGGGVENLDGIHFDKEVGSGADIKIDGNRIGYFANNVGGSVSNSAGGYNRRIADDGIEFKGPITGSADIDITDNFIRAKDDGIQFSGSVSGTANILIGGDLTGPDGNTINAWDDGISFLGDVTGHSKVAITHNDVDGGGNGVAFYGNTSNHDHSGHSEEILIAYNDIEGDENGILFEGRASHELHDIVIRDNTRIMGWNEDSIAHTGGIDDAELFILDNDEIYGDRDGIHIEGNFFSNAKILIDGNTDIEADDGDGIEITDVGGTGGADVDVTNNHIHHTGDNGIEIANVDGVNVEDNEVHDTDGHGIYVSNSDRARIIDNDLWDLGEHGILVNPSDFVDIAYNEVHDAAWDGIHVDGGYDAWIWDNHVGRTGDDGIQVDGNNSVDIWDNYIHDTGLSTGHGDGISVRDSNYATITNNDITGAGRDGINVWSSYRVDIEDNTIFGEDAGVLTIGKNGAGRDGIHVEHSDRVDIIDNDILGGDGGILAIGGAGAGRDGIYVSNSDNADIEGNEISGGNYGVLAFGGNGANRDGIHVVNSFNADIIGNDIFGGTGFVLGAGGLGAGEDGIFVYNSDYTDVRWNDVSEVGDDGIDVRRSDNADIKFNDVSDTGGDGIQVRDSSFAEINWNLIYNAGDDGIDFEDGSFSEIKSNSVWFSENNGIEVEDSAFITIGGDDWWEGNIVAGSGESGIFVDPSFFINVQNNTTFWNQIGIEFDDVWFGNIQDNNVFQNLVGISVENSHLINVEGNEIANNLFGMWAYGGNNGYIRLHNNIFTDNFIHAGFNSGIIDLTSLDVGAEYSNQFIGGNVALVFDVWDEKNPESLSLVREGGIFAGGYTYDGTPNDTFNGTTVFPPSDFGGTIGSQLFDGQEDQFVIVGDGTFVDPISGDAIWLDAQDSTYRFDPDGDGLGPLFKPSDQPFLTAAQLSFLEDMFFHYRDVDNRGIFFFGLLPPTFDIQQERVFNQFDPFAGTLANLNVTVTGLPSTGPLPGGPAGPGTGGTPSPFALAGINPAAGGGEPTAEYLANLEPAAGPGAGGTSPEELAGIEPAAGGQEVACWGDVAAGAGAGSAASLNWGGTFEDSIAAATNCASGAF